MSNPDALCAARGKCDGVLQILQYNVGYYVASLITLVVTSTLLWLQLVPWRMEMGLAGLASLAMFWSLSSLIISYYVYDYAGVTRWKWLPGMVLFPPRRWLNIHTGLDQSTEILREFFPGTGYVVLDIYDPQEMTEPSIARARRVQLVRHSAVPSKLDRLPLPDRDRDTLFLLFAAHEIREPKRRVAFFQEAARLLGTPGQLLLVEHLRDWKNFVAFGPGFLHFYTRREWLRIASEAGLTIEREGWATPFVRCFVMSRSAG